jgi:hypothetical protein
MISFREFDRLNKKYRINLIYKKEDNMARNICCGFALIILVLLNIIVFAEDKKEGDKNLNHAQELLNSLKGCDKSLFGTYRFGVYLGHTKNVGNLTFVVDKAPETSKAIYYVKSSWKIAVANNDFAMEYVSFLGEDFSVISETIDFLAKDKGKTITRKGEIKKKDGFWVFDVLANGDKKTYKAEDTGKNHMSFGSVFLLLRKMNLNLQGDYVFMGINCPDPEEDSEEDDALAPWQNFTITVSAPCLNKHRNKEVMSYKLTINDCLDGDFTIIMGENNQMLSLDSEANSTSIIAGTDEEVAKDIADNQAPETKEIIKTVMVYILVIANEKKVEALDEVMDWKSIQQEVSKNDSSVAEMDLDEFSETMKSRFKKSQGALKKEQADLLESTMQIEIKNNKAIVFIPGSDSPFKLKKTEGKWKITSFPH